ncbi:MAG TPA: heparan-alpha-glucosaminide N-acetyltransferase domain-containing protein [Gemmatimonadaceae bacterium]|nr:heparan-alpha-glucosaminide N-acetyltransferase domain-containing protein [Gemmatimonadaceae bacterium]
MSDSATEARTQQELGPVHDGLTASGRQARLLALDVFRGLTIVGMLLVNVPGDASAVYTQLRHSAWNGCTIADVVFPFFLFVVGITTHLSLSSRAARGDSDGVLRRQILRRGALLFAIGFLLNWFPFYQYGAIAGQSSPSFIDHVAARLLELRLLGVLQRIGLVYVAAALLTFRAPTKRVVVIVVTLLIGYWLALTLVPVPGQERIGALLLNEPSRTLAAWVDHVTLDWTRWGLGNHIWRGSVEYDPEGLLTTLPAIATTMIGVLAGRLLGGQGPLSTKLRSLFAAGALLVAAGLVWSIAFPINKNLWTSSYVLFTTGIACAVLSAIAWLVDAKGYSRWAQPLVVFGVNPITAYVGAELTAILFDSTIKFRVDERMRSVHELAYERLLAPWLEPRLASLVYSLVFVALWYGLLLVLYRRRVILKI